MTHDANADLCAHPELENQDLRYPVWTCRICGAKVNDGGPVRDG